MFELEKKCWKEYLKKTSYRTNKIIDWIMILGLFYLFFTSTYIFKFENKRIIEEYDNKLVAILLLVAFGIIYIVRKIILTQLDKQDKKKRKQNLVILKKILNNNKCNIKHFSVYFNLIKEKKFKKIKNIKNMADTIFAFFLTILFTLVDNESKTYNLMEIFWIFLAYHCLKQLLRIMYNCFNHYDISLVLEKTEEQLLYLTQLEEQNKNNSNIISKIKKFLKFFI